ncbi:MAG: hypothetical protein MRZ79_15735 [Bacteroidia bacterium]|nr:hypothetical protein [Bacteroidia bacterium]
MANLHEETFQGIWTYRSWLNETDLTKTADVNNLLFGAGYIRIDPSMQTEFKGLIYGQNDLSKADPHAAADWALNLKGSTNFGNPFTVRFQGKGIVSGSEWIYDYVGYLVLPWQNGVQQKMAMVGSIVRVIPHPNGSGGISPAGVTASWYAVKN